LQEGFALGRGYEQGIVAVSRLLQQHELDTAVAENSEAMSRMGGESKLYNDLAQSVDPEQILALLADFASSGVSPEHLRLGAALALMDVATIPDANSNSSDVLSGVSSKTVLRSGTTHVKDYQTDQQTEKARHILAALLAASTGIHTVSS
jgi:hypothetical protein